MQHWWKDQRKLKNYESNSFRSHFTHMWPHGLSNEWALVSALRRRQTCFIYSGLTLRMTSIPIKATSVPWGWWHFPPKCLVDCVWNVMAHAEKPDFFFRRNGRVHLNRRGRQFSRLLAAKVCASAVVMLDTPCSKVVWRVLATHSIRQFPLHLPSRASPCAITFQLDSTYPP